ncbi:transposase [Streptomyces sp. NPDC017991]|uniref:transposase n=1 Tax=Streptomyces sp. NPDC017991 TaxID=3365026 RepID=UPI003798E46F
MTDALIKRILASVLKRGITDYIGHEKHDSVGENNGNSRNGTCAKTLPTDVGPVAVRVPRGPRGTVGSSESQITKKRQRRLTWADEMVLLSTTGLTREEMPAHLAEVSS